MKMKIDSLTARHSFYDFYPGFDEANFVAADGTSYLFESFNGEMHCAVYGWIGGSYKGKEDLFWFINLFHSLIPKDVLPDYHNATIPADLLFPVFKEDSLIH